MEIDNLLSFLIYVLKHNITVKGFKITPRRNTPSPRTHIQHFDICHHKQHQYLQFIYELTKKN